MKKQLLIVLFVLFSLPLISQSYYSVQLTEQSFSEFFKGKDQSKYTAIFLFGADENVSFSNGNEVGLNVAEGKELVIFTPKGFSSSNYFTFIDNEGKELKFDLPLTNNELEFSQIKCYNNDQKLLSTFKF